MQERGEIEGLLCIRDKIDSLLTPLSGKFKEAGYSSQILPKSEKIEREVNAGVSAFSSSLEVKLMNLGK